MGNKANILTLRKSEINLNLYRNNPFEFLYGYSFLKLLETFFKSYKVFLVKFILNFVENKIFINFILFFNIVKILKIKRKLSVSNFEEKRAPLCHFIPNILSSIILKQLKLLNKNLIIFQYTSLNFYLKKKINLITLLFKKFKRYSDTLFPRRFRFFLDFIKLSLLFSSGNIHSLFYIKILTEIFRILQKQRHMLFFKFIKLFFVSLMELKDSNLKGFKFSISGNLKGKRRSSDHFISFGLFPLRSFNQQIEFAKSHAFTIFGVFGLKLWVYRVNPLK